MSEVGFIVDPVAFQESAIRMLRAWSSLSAATVGLDASDASLVAEVRDEVLSYAGAMRRWIDASWVYRVDAGNADVLDRSAERYRVLFDRVRLARESLGLPRADATAPGAVRRIADIFSRMGSAVSSGGNALVFGALLIGAAYFLGGRRR